MSNFTSKAHPIEVQIPVGLKSEQTGKKICKSEALLLEKMSA